MAFGAGKEHAGEIEQRIGAMGRFYLAGNADCAALVGKEFDGYIRRLNLRGLMLAGLETAAGVATALLARFAPSVIGVPAGPVGTFCLRLGVGLPSGGGILPGTVVAPGRTTRSLAAARPAPAVVTAPPPAEIIASTGTPILVPALVVCIGILTGWLLEPVRHQLEVEVHRQFGHGVRNKLILSKCPTVEDDTERIYMREIFVAKAGGAP